ncbi:MFS general substrate transporter [Echria macrotheca]|uniref:MFS general substrate transporter n=1 Tax=Echria macrotheca TaxID=438768 RepID=A0AAJ0BCG1_9PEZI|nr:MFS general substrate transporter [Echria macrotheca]
MNVFATSNHYDDVPATAEIELQTRNAQVGGQPPEPAWDSGLYDAAIEPSEHHGHLTGIKLVAVVAATTMAVFLTMLDSSIVATAIPRITDEFHAIDDIGWYASGYQLSSAVFQPLTGKIYSRFSLKWSFLAFFIIFEIGSAVCGAARSSHMFIVGRCVAGLGSAALLNGTLTIVAAAVPLERRPSLTGAAMGLSQLGIAVGPVLGGVFTSFASWRWCFYINLPVGALVFLGLAFTRIPEQIEKGNGMDVLKNLHRELDIRGFFLLASPAIMLLAALQLGGDEYAWNSPTIIGLFTRAGVVFLVWLAWDWYCGDDALVPFFLMRNTVIAAGSLVQWCTMSSVFVASYFLPLYFQAVKDATPVMSGVYVLASIGTQLLSAVSSGVLVEKTGYVIPYAVVSGAVSAVSNGLYSTLSPSSPVSHWVGFQILNGFGRGLGLQMPLLAAQTVLSPADLSLGLAMLVFSGMLGTSITLAVADTMFGQKLRSELAKVVSNQTEVGRIIQAGATDFRRVVKDPAKLSDVLEAYANSIKQPWYLAAGLGALSVFSSLFLGWIDVRGSQIM